MIGIWLRLLLCVLLGVSDGVSHADTLRIAAASSLRFALDDIVRSFEDNPGSEVKAAEPKAGDVKLQVVYGSSGNLFRQILQGAPFDLFLSADAQLIERLVEAGKTNGNGDDFGVGRVVLFGSRSRLISSDPALVLRQGIEQGGEFRLAIANPGHAPYGRAAQQALESFNLWDALKPHLVYGEKVSQAAGFVANGATSMGIISLSLALSPVFLEAGTYSTIAEENHQPIVQRMVRIGVPEESHIKENQLLFFRYLQTNAVADEIFKRYGLR